MVVAVREGFERRRRIRPLAELGGVGTRSVQGDSPSSVIDSYFLRTRPKHGYLSDYCHFKIKLLLI